MVNKDVTNTYKTKQWQDVEKAPKDAHHAVVWEPLAKPTFKQLWVLSPEL
jgi:hypothetical protein